MSTNSQVEAKANQGKNDQTITINIQTAQGTLIKDFDKNDKIENIIQAVKEKFGFAADGDYAIVKKSADDESLSPQRTIVSYGLIDNEILLFTDFGKAA